MMEEKALYHAMNCDCVAMLTALPNCPCSGSNRVDTPDKAGWDALVVTATSAGLSEQWKQTDMIHNTTKGRPCWFHGLFSCSV